MSPFQLAWLNLIRHRFSTLITIVAITLSVTVSGILFHLYRLSTSRFESISTIGDAVVGAKANSLDILLSSLNFEGAYPQFVPYHLYLSLSEHEGVKFEDGAQTNGLQFARAFPFTFIGRIEEVGPKGRVGTSRVVATESTFLTPPTAAINEFPSPTLASGKWDEVAGSAIIGSNFASSHQLNLGDALTAQTWLGESNPSQSFQMKVVGILSPMQSSWDDAIFTNPQTRAQVLASGNIPTIWKNDVVHFMIFQMTGAQFPALRDLVNSRTVSQAIDVRSERARLEELTGTGRELGLSMTILIIALGALCVVAMLVTRFEALSIQIAVLRASGYALSEIAGWLVWEGVLLGLTSVTIGSVLQLALFPVLRKLLIEWIPMSSAHVSIVSSLFTVGLTAFLATLVAAVIPFFRLSKQNVHEALRGV